MNAPIQIAVREQTCAACNCRPAALPSAFCGVFEWGAMDLSFVGVAEVGRLVTYELHRGCDL